MLVAQRYAVAFSPEATATIHTSLTLRHSDAAVSGGESRHAWKQRQSFTFQKHRLFTVIFSKKHDFLGIKYVIYSNYQNLMLYLFRRSPRILVTGRPGQFMTRQLLVTRVRRTMIFAPLRCWKKFCGHRMKKTDRDFAMITSLSTSRLHAVLTRLSKLEDVRAE